MAGGAAGRRRDERDRRTGANRRVEQTLATATSAAEVMDVRDKAETLRQLLRKQRRGLELQNRVAEIKLRAERKLGGMLQEAIRPGNPQLLHGVTVRLKDLGIGRTQSHRWQLIAGITDAEFERHIAETKARGDELTTAGAIRLAKAIRWRPLFSSQSVQWKTPVEVIESTLRLLGEIDLDPSRSRGRSRWATIKFG